MVWKIEYSLRALKALNQVDNTIKNRIKKQIVEQLATSDDPKMHPQVKAIIGIENLFRYRVGRYRVLFRVFEQKVVIYVVNAGHRSKIYARMDRLKRPKTRGLGFGDD